ELRRLALMAHVHARERDMQMRHQEIEQHAMALVAREIVAHAREERSRAAIIEARPEGKAVGQPKLRRAAVELLLDRGLVLRAQLRPDDRPLLDEQLAGDGIDALIA